MTRPNRLQVFGLLLCLAFATGCSRGPEYAPVNGKVTKGGQPLGNVRVEFWPEIDGVKSTGVTDSEGRYTLTAEDGKNTGALVGPHRVVLKDLDQYGSQFLGRKGENVPDLSGGKKPRFSAKLVDASGTSLRKTVASGGNAIDIEVP